MPAVQTRPLRADDLDAVSGIESRIVGRPRKGFLEKRFAAAAAAPDGFIACAALVDGKLAGYAFARLQEGEFGTREAVAVLDVVGVAVHSHFHLPRKEMTERICRAMRNPHADILFHPTGRVLGRREPYEVDFEEIVRVALETGTALEIDAFPDRLDLNDDHARRAVEAG